MPEEPYLADSHVFKHSGVIQISSDHISLLQRKSFNILLRNAYGDLEKTDTYKFRVWDLCRALGYNDTKDLKAALKRLTSTTVEFNELQSRDKETWAVTSLLADALIKDDWLYYSYGPLLREKLQNPAVYARINLSIQRLFKTKYALALYELCCDHFIRKQGSGQTPWIDLLNLRRLLGCAEDMKYGEFKHLNHRVLKKAILEVNRNSDMHVEMKTQKKKKTVIAVQFIITENPNKGAMIQQIYAPQQAEMPLAPGGALFTRLTNEYGLTENQASEVVGEYDSDYIEDKLIYVTKRASAGKVDSLGAFTYQALMENYKTTSLEMPQLTATADSGVTGNSGIRNGMKIDINGIIHSVEDGRIRTERGIIPEGDIVKGLASGKFKEVVD